MVAALFVMVEQARAHVSGEDAVRSAGRDLPSRAPQAGRGPRRTTAADCTSTTAWESDDLPLAAATAKVVTGKAVAVTAANAQQLLAGIGFTAEHPFHRFMKRTLVLERMLGSATELAPRWVGN